MKQFLGNDCKMVRYYKVAFKDHIPNFTGDTGCADPEFIVMQKTEFEGKTQIGSKVKPLGIEHYKGAHLEGCEVREIQWLSKRVGTIIGYTYIPELI